MKSDSGLQPSVCCFDLLIALDLRADGLRTGLGRQQKMVFV